MTSQPTNSPIEAVFFKTISADQHEEVRRLVGETPELLNAFNYKNFGATPLTTTSFSHQIAMTETLLELGADPNRRSDWYMGPWSPLHCAAFRRDHELTKRLLKHGATMDLHTAAGMGDLESLDRLIRSEPARVSELGGDGCQPLHFADTIPVAQRLLESGAKIDARCVDHYSTPAQYLCSIRPEVACYLFSQGAEPDIFSVIMAGDEDRLGAMITADSSLLNARISQAFFPPSPEHDVHNIMTFTVGLDATPMHAAVRANNQKMISILHRHGLSPNVRGGYDDAMPLHLAAWHDQLQAAEGLVAIGAELNAKSGQLHNNTPAGWAIVGGSYRVFNYLMDQGAIRHEWFLDDARDGADGRFDLYNRVPREQRIAILEKLSYSK
jgi:ankyrin repeat protein